jgi:hypothetical protein
MTDNCEVGHSWEVYSGDGLVCIFCDVEATAVIDEDDGDD